MADAINSTVKLAIVALVANAMWHVFVVYSADFRFKDAVQSTAQYRGEKTDAEVRGRILELAAQFDVPITNEDLSVRSEGGHTFVEASYVRRVDLVPGFTYPWPFTVHLDTPTPKPSSSSDLVPK